MNKKYEEMLIDQIADLLSDIGGEEAIEFINYVQEKPSILEDIRMKVAEKEDCCPYCGNPEYYERENSNGVTGYWEERWVEAVCKKCGEVI